MIFQKLKEPINIENQQLFYLMTSIIKTEIEYRSKIIDTLGRYRFFLNWSDPNGKKRSQIFFANPRDYGFEPPIFIDNETVGKAEIKNEKPTMAKY